MTSINNIYFVNVYLYIKIYSWAFKSFYCFVIEIKQSILKLHVFGLCAEIESLRRRYVIFYSNFNL